ncbi:MAG TPA: YiiD C-terminal domain-containing protein [Rhodanobacteraceae bacterium]|nr:YiiD C-terminal domain-containing protein [Rhodanobacteraceae bacterium]
MTDTNHSEPAAQLQAYILEHIPLARTMELRVTRHDGAELELTAPLAPNINDKGCAFGGSMASLMTLAGWGLVELALRARGIECDIYVGDSIVRYREPLFGELRASARFAEADGLDLFLKTLAARGKARIQVVCGIAGEKQDAATLEAAFVAKGC